MTIDLSAPSNDTPTLLRQWLAAYKGETAPAESVFHQDKEQAEREIVELTAAITADGTAFYQPGDVTPSLLVLARKLNAGNRFRLTPLFLSALATGLPKFAQSIGVASESVVARTGPKS